MVGHLFSRITHEGSDAPRHHKTLLATTALLPYSYTPLEVAVTNARPSHLVGVFLVAIAVKYRVHEARPSTVDVVVGMLVFWILFRTLVLPPLAGDSPDIAMGGREAINLLGGLVMFRLARIAELRRTILLGLLLALAAILAVEA